MTHKRNTDGLVRAAKERRQQTITRVNAAIKKLVKENKKVNFNIISKIANVGKPWLYQETNIRGKIEKLRQSDLKKDSVGSNILRQTASDKSKDSIICMLKERIKKLTAANKDLKNQLEIVYGKLYRQEEIK